MGGDPDPPQCYRVQGEAEGGYRTEVIGRSRRLRTTTTMGKEKEKNFWCWLDFRESAVYG